MKVRWFKRIVLLCLLSIFLIFGLIGYWIHSNKASVINSRVDYLIILGSPVIDSKPSISLQERLDVGIEIGSRCDCVIIVTGHLEEGHTMKAYLIEHGIEKSKILVDAYASNTYYNLVNSKALIHEYALTHGLSNQNLSIGIITSDFHVARVYLLSQRVFNNTDVISVQGVTSSSKMLNIREYFAYIKSFLLDR